MSYAETILEGATSTRRKNTPPIHTSFFTYKVLGGLHPIIITNHPDEIRSRAQMTGMIPVTIDDNPNFGLVTHESPDNTPISWEKFLEILHATDFTAVFYRYGINQQVPDLIRRMDLVPRHHVLDLLNKPGCPAPKPYNGLPLLTPEEVRRRPGPFYYRDGYGNTQLKKY